MRYTHGCKPRNPYNMIIQENIYKVGKILCDTPTGVSHEIPIT